MSHTSFGLFLNHLFKVKFKKNIEEQLKFFYEVGYADYRVGCNLCETGQARSLKTNITDFINEEYFYLNDLKLSFNDVWYNQNHKHLDLNIMYETTNKEIIKKIYQYHLKFNNIDGYKQILIRPNDEIKMSSGLTSCFTSENSPDECITENELEDISDVHICLNCYKWFISVNEEKDFIEQNPLKYFWFDFADDYLYDVIEFETLEDMNDFCKWCNTNNSFSISEKSDTIKKFTVGEKIEIAKQIKNITLEDVEEDMNKLINIGTKANMQSERSKIGNNVVDHFTFLQRLETKGKYNVNFFEFIANLDTFKEKKFIQNMLKYYEDVKNKNKTKHMYKVLKEVYNICISAINIMKPLNCMEIYTRFNAKRVLNFCAGWGGSMVAAAALNLEAYYGIEINGELKEPYANMESYLRTKSSTEFGIYFCDAVDFDYEALEYDTVFSSPPYYFIEKYPNNVEYKSKKDMNEKFYKPVFLKSYNVLKKDGHFIINVCKEAYDNVLKKLFGDAHITFPLKKSQRQNNYTEMVYVWRK